MGFIENLRQKAMQEKIAREENEKRRKSDLETARQREKEESKETQDKQYAASIKYRDQSDFPRLAGELKALVGGMEISTSNSHIYDDAVVRLFVSWDDHMIKSLNYGRTLRSDKHFEVKFYPDGRIRVKGGWFGSTSLSFEDWNGNPSVQEEALGKAFRFPKKYFYTTDPPPPFSY